MRTERPSLSLGLVLLLAPALGLSFLERRLVGEMKADPQIADCAGAAAVWVADWGWMQAYLAWTRNDEEGMRNWLRVVRAAQPAQEYFSFNAARMLAYDVPAWRLAAEPAAPAAVQQQWRNGAGEEAIAWIAPEQLESAAGWMEAGNIALHALRDRARAADYYGRAAGLSGAPWHAGRIHARLLIETGRRREALDFLRRWVPLLPGDHPAAQRALMEEWRDSLERAASREGF